jgi:hypothetical protein
MRRGYIQSVEHVRKRMESMRAHAVSRKPVTKEWLEAKYIGAGLDCVQIGKIVNRDPKSVWSWMKDYGIPTRTRGRSHACLPTDGRGFRGKRHTGAFREMMRACRVADGHVPYLKTGVHWLKTVPPESHPNWKGGCTPERQALYASAEWVAAVKVVWARAGARCARCGVHHNTTPRRGTFHIHHIVSFRVRELRAVVSNLALLCKPCHLFVHSNANVAHLFIREP